MTAKPKPYQVGQEVLVLGVTRSTEPEPGTVTKVGRTLVYVKTRLFPEPVAYRMDTGHANGEWGRSRITSPDGYAEEQARAQAWARLRKLGIDRGYGAVTRHYTSTTLNQIADLLEGQTDGD